MNPNCFVIVLESYLQNDTDKPVLETNWTWIGVTYLFPSLRYKKTRPLCSTYTLIKNLWSKSFSVKSVSTKFYRNFFNKFNLKTNLT